jgi:hypothetical protein
MGAVPAHSPGSIFLQLSSLLKKIIFVSIRIDLPLQQCVLKKQSVTTISLDERLLFKVISKELLIAETSKS